MKAMLTSSLGGVIKVNGRRIPDVLIQQNGLLDKLKSIWPQDAKVLIICGIRITMRRMTEYMLV